MRAMLRTILRWERQGVGCERTSAVGFTRAKSSLLRSLRLFMIPTRSNSRARGWIVWIVTRMGMSCYRSEATSREDYFLSQSPLLPPLFFTTLIDPISISRPATALHMSHTVRHATLTPMSASISTPVLPSHSAVAVTTSEWFVASGVTVTEMWVRERG